MPGFLSYLSFRTMAAFYGEKNLAQPLSWITPLSAIRDCLCNIFAATLYRVRLANSVPRIRGFRTVFQLLTARGGKVSMRSYLQPVFCYEELGHHRCKEFVSV
jgi:hypothetical protein